MQRIDCQGTRILVDKRLALQRIWFYSRRNIKQKEDYRKAIVLNKETWRAGEWITKGQSWIWAIVQEKPNVYERGQIVYSQTWKVKCIR